MTDSLKKCIRVLILDRRKLLIGVDKSRNGLGKFVFIWSDKVELEEKALA